MNQGMTLDRTIAARYIQGELSGDESDRFESECLGTAEYREYLAETGLLERYLRQALTRAELEAVEKAICGDPDLLAEIEGISAVEKGLDDLRASGSFESARYRRRTTTILRSPQYSLAASIAAAGLLIFSGYLMIDNQSLRDEVGTVFDSPVTRTIPLDTVRAGNATTLIPAPPDGMLTTLSLDAAYLSDGRDVWFDDYRATVVASGGDGDAPIFERGGLPLNVDDTVAITIPAQRLAPGRYEVTLAGRMSDWPEAREYELVRRLSFEVAEAD